MVEKKKRVRLKKAHSDDEFTSLKKMHLLFLNKEKYDFFLAGGG